MKLVNKLSFNYSIALLQVLNREPAPDNLFFAV